MGGILIKKIAIIVGTRPEFIQLELLYKQLKGIYNVVLIHTGQHYDYRMSQQFFTELELPPPNYYLGIGAKSAISQITTGIIKLERVFLKEHPLFLIISGDTNSSLIGALTAIKMKIPIIHLEAGPRTYDKKMPEEINRIIIDNVSTLLFAPTKTSLNNLKKEKITTGIYFTGDIMLDSFKKYNRLIKMKKTWKKFHLQRKKYILLTIHREENTNNIENIERIFNSLLKNKEKIFFPIHPRTKKLLIQRSILSKLKKNPKIIICDSLPYFEFLNILNNSKTVITDSGGVQKQAFFLKVPCITIWSCKRTGWPETLINNWNIIIQPIEKDIKKALTIKRGKSSPNLMFFGDGKSVKKMISIIINKFHY